MQSKPKQEMKLTKKKKLEFPYLYELLLLIANLFAVFSIFFFLRRVEATAYKIRDVKSTSVSEISTANLETAQARLDQGKEKIDAVTGMFAGEDGIVEFVKEMDILKRDGFISSFSFASDKVVEDKRTRSKVLPFTIVVDGDMAKINYVMKKLYSLPYLIGDVVVESQKKEDGSYGFSYGGYLYVNEEFGNN